MARPPAMNDRELHDRLHRLPLPERPGEYWEDFPARIRRQLRPPSAVTAAHRSRPAPLVWTADFAFGLGLLLLFCVQFHAAQLTYAAINRHERVTQTQLARLDAGLHRFVLKAAGLGDLLTDAN